MHTEKYYKPFKLVQKRLTAPESFDIIYVVKQHMRMWRNWQTRKIQVLMVARLCRFKSCHPHQYGASLKTGTKRRDTESLFFIPENACALSAVDSEYRNSDARTRRYRLLAKPSRCSLQVLSSAPIVISPENSQKVY